MKRPTNELLDLHLLLLQTTGVDFILQMLTILRQAYSEFPIHLILNQSWLTLITLLEKTLDKMLCM